MFHAGRRRQVAPPLPLPAGPLPLDALAPTLASANLSWNLFGGELPPSICQRALFLDIRDNLGLAGGPSILCRLTTLALVSTPAASAQQQARHAPGCPATLPCSSLHPS